MHTLSELTATHFTAKPQLVNSPHLLPTMVWDLGTKLQATMAVDGGYMSVFVACSTEKLNLHSADDESSLESQEC